MKPTPARPTRSMLQLSKLLLNNRLKPLIRLVPRRGLPRPIFLNLKAAANDVPSLGYAADRSLRAGLHHGVPEALSFHWPSNHFPIGRAGRLLTKEYTLGPAADNMNRVDPAADQL